MILEDILIDTEAILTALFAEEAFSQSARVTALPNVPVGTAAPEVVKTVLSSIPEYQGTPPVHAARD